MGKAQITKSVRGGVVVALFSAPSLAGVACINQEVVVPTEADRCMDVCTGREFGDTPRALTSGRKAKKLH